MSDWTSRRDSEPCCLGPDGNPGAAVGDGETVARLLHTKIIEPEGRPFRREELFPRKGQPHSSACGKADGVSVVRRDGLTDDEVRARAAQHARRTPGRTQQGAVQASAGRLRALQLPDSDGGQVVFLYDGPGADVLPMAGWRPKPARWMTSRRSRDGQTPQDAWTSGLTRLERDVRAGRNWVHDGHGRCPDFRSP